MLTGDSFFFSSVRCVCVFSVFFSFVVVISSVDKEKGANWGIWLFFFRSIDDDNRNGYGTNYDGHNFFFVGGGRGRELNSTSDLQNEQTKKK